MSMSPIICAYCGEPTPGGYRRTSPTRADVYVCVWCAYAETWGGYLGLESQAPWRLCEPCGGPRVPGVGCPCNVMEEDPEAFADAEDRLAGDDLE